MSTPIDTTFDAIEQFLGDDCTASNIPSTQDDDLATTTAEFAKEMESLLSVLNSNMSATEGNLFCADLEKELEALFSSDHASIAPELQRSDSSASSDDLNKDIEAALSFFEAVTTADAPALQLADSTASSDTEPEAITPPVQTVALSDVLVNPVVPNLVPKLSTVKIVPIAASPVKAGVDVTNPAQQQTVAPLHAPTFFPRQSIPPVYPHSPFTTPMPAPGAYMQMMQEQAIMQAQMQMQMQAYAQMAAFYQQQQTPRKRQKPTGRVARAPAPSKRDALYTRPETIKRAEKDDEPLITGWVAPGWVQPSVPNAQTTSTLQ